MCATVSLYFRFFLRVVAAAHGMRLAGAMPDVLNMCTTGGKLKFPVHRVFFFIKPGIEERLCAWLGATQVSTASAWVLGHF